MTALAVFAFTYALIAGRRWRALPLGRPAGALLGAALMVATGAMSPARAYAAVDLGTLGLLFAMMLFGAWLSLDGTLDGLEERVLARAGSPWRLLVGLSLSAALLSALLVNDTVCVLFTPLVVRVCVRRKLPLLPYLLALSTSANLGSAATLIGNPQNMLIARLSGIGFARFALLSLPAVLAAFVAQIVLLHLYFRRSLPEGLAPAEPSPRQRLRPGVPLALLGVLAGFIAGFDLTWTALVGAALVMAARREDPAPAFARVDWTLLVFFGGLFVVVGGLDGTGLVDRAFAAVAPALDLGTPRGLASFSLFVTAGSNLVSNVPMVMVLGPFVQRLGSPELAWVLLAFCSTIAGNLTLVGSVANLIVAEAAREHHEIGFFEYLRFGAATTAASLLLGVPLIAWMAG